MPHPRRHVPVDRAEVVALLVFADFGELDALPAEHRAVFAAEQRVVEAAGAGLAALDLAQHLRGDGAPAPAQRGVLAAAAVDPLVLHGAATASRIFAMSRSESMSSASASNVSSTRCRCAAN